MILFATYPPSNKLNRLACCFLFKIISPELARISILSPMNEFPPTIPPRACHRFPGPQSAAAAGEVHTERRSPPAPRPGQSPPPAEKSVWNFFDHPCPGKSFRGRMHHILPGESSRHPNIAWRKPYLFPSYRNSLLFQKESQFLPQPVQPGDQRPFLDAVPGGNFFWGVPEPVPPNKYHLIFPGLGFQECIEKPAQFLCFHAVIPAAVGNALLHLLGQGYDFCFPF